MLAQKLHRSQARTRRTILLRYLELSLACLLLSSCNAAQPSGGPHSTFLAKIDSYPAESLLWSPTGKQLAVSTFSGSTYSSEIYVLDIQTGKSELFLHSGYGRIVAKSWTPDGKQLLFSADSSRDLSNGIWVAPISAPNPPHIFLDESANVAWSSSGQLAIARRDKTGMLAVYIRDSRTGEELPVFRHLGTNIDPLSWSADGGKLAFSLDHGEFRNRDIYVIDVKTKEAHQITRGGTNDYPSLSPNGKMVTYIKGDFSGSVPLYPLHIMNSDGSCDMEVPGFEENQSLGLSPTWSPEGRQIAFIGERNGIFILDLSGAFGENFLVSGLLC